MFTLSASSFVWSIRWVGWQKLRNLTISLQWISWLDKYLLLAFKILMTRICISFRLPVEDGKQCKVRFGQQEMRFHQVSIISFSNKSIIPCKKSVLYLNYISSHRSHFTVSLFFSGTFSVVSRRSFSWGNVHRYTL